MSDLWRTTVLGISDPLTQRYIFARYVLGEPRMSALGIAAAHQNSGPMDEKEYDVVKAGW